MLKSYSIALTLPYNVFKGYSPFVEGLITPGMVTVSIVSESIGEALVFDSGDIP